MTDLQDFRDKMSNYKSYREQNPGKTYLDWKKAIQELKHIDIDNDPTYDYKGYCDLNNFAAQDMLNKKSDAHFTDNFKTSQHPTFSEESGYSGYINKFNPNGITGGSWGDHSYNLSDSQMANDWDIKNTLDYLSIAENEGVSLKYDDKYPVIDDTVIGGVLPEVEVKGYAHGGQIPLLGNKAKLFTQQDLNTMHDLNINAGAYDQPTSEVQHRINSKGKVKTVPTPGNGFVSNNDPVGQFVVEGVATAPLFNLFGKAALFSAARMGNKWARSKIISQVMDNSLLEPKKYLDNTYGEVTNYLFDKLHPELNRIGSKDQYKQYLYRTMPASSTSKVYYHGSNSNFLGSSQDQKAFKQFVSPNNREYITISSERNNPSQFQSELDWSPESWFKLRSDGRYDQADIDALKSHVLEYNKIEQEAKANGTWLKMKDGSTWEGDPRIWVQMQSKSFINNANKTSNLMKNNSGDIIIQEHLGRPNITTFDSKKYATTGMGHNKNGGGTYSFPKEQYDADAGKYTKDAYIRLYKRNNNDQLPEPYYIYSFNRNTYKANLGDTKINPDESFDSIITPQQFTTGEKVNPNDIYSDDILTNFDMLTSRNPNLLKSVIGNNGDFNLNNSNIYKSLFPIGIGLGATSVYNKK